LYQIGSESVTAAQVGKKKVNSHSTETIEDEVCFTFATSILDRHTEAEKKESNSILVSKKNLNGKRRHREQINKNSADQVKIPKKM
jgi:hypothetical protein